MYESLTLAAALEVAEGVREGGNGWSGHGD